MVASESQSQSSAILASKKCNPGLQQYDRNCRLRHVQHCSACHSRRPQFTSVSFAAAEVDHHGKLLALTALCKTRSGILTAASL